MTNYLENYPPHCAACKTVFTTGQEFMEHIDDCIPTNHLIGPLLAHFNDDTIGHKKSNLFTATVRASREIEKYAHAVANELPNNLRSQYHQDLCNKLNIKYENLRPFESETIKTLPTYTQCLDIIYFAINDYFYKL